MEEDWNTMENGIKLQDGRIIQGYPKQAETEETAENHMFDTTGEYFGIKKKPKSRPVTDEEELRLKKLFTDNAFLILANRERILNDSRMLLTPVHVRNGLAYSGAFQTATLGVYLEWWMNAPYSVLFEEDDTMSLIWFVSGSPLSGSNRCAKVYEDGRTEEERVPFFIRLWPKFADILADYHDPKKLYQAYTLPEVIDILKRETTVDEYAKSITEFYYKAKVNLLNAELNGWKERRRRSENESNDYQRKWHSALIQSRINEVKDFYDRYTWKKEAVRIRTEELAEANREMKARLRKGELTNREYQPLLTGNKKEVENMWSELRDFEAKGLVSLFPEMADYSYETCRIKCTEASILDEIIELFEQGKEATITDND